jgi:flagellar biosynthesis chaperone FliJ
MQESELELQKALKKLQNAKNELEKSIKDLEKLKSPKNGNMQEFLAQRTLLDAQLRLIEKNRDWVAYEETQLKAIQEQYKKDMIEYEKFKYLQAQEVEKIKKKLALQESKRLDEVAIMRYKNEEAI